jgi:hypothetical protein
MQSDVGATLIAGSALALVSSVVALLPLGPDFGLFVPPHPFGVIAWAPLLISGCLPPVVRHRQTERSPPAISPRLLKITDGPPRLTLATHFGGLGHQGEDALRVVVFDIGWVEWTR